MEGTPPGFPDIPSDRMMALASYLQRRKERELAPFARKQLAAERQIMEIERLGDQRHLDIVLRYPRGVQEPLVQEWWRLQKEASRINSRETERRWQWDWWATQDNCEELDK